MPFSMAELDFALQQGKGKSCGPSDIGYPMLKNLPITGELSLLRCFNQEWINDTLPAAWKHSLVVPIPKKEGVFR